MYLGRIMSLNFTNFHMHTVLMSYKYMDFWGWNSHLVVWLITMLIKMLVSKWFLAYNNVCSLQWSIFARQSHWFDWWSWFTSPSSTCTGILFVYPLTSSSFFFIFLNRPLTSSSNFYYFANWAFMWFQLPEEAKELDKEVRKIVKEKEEFVRNQDFEKVTSFTEDLTLKFNLYTLPV